MKKIDKFKIVIVEDEQISSEELKYIILKDNRFEVVGQAYDGISGLNLVEIKKPEIVFVDINIPGKNGIELAEEIKKLLPSTIIIFSTAYEGYAIKAFELKVYDYILKPYDIGRIIDSLNSAIELINMKKDNEIIDILDKIKFKQACKKIPCESNGRLILVDINKICFCYSERDNNYIKTCNDTYCTSKTLQELEEKTNFCRCHRSYLVNLDKINEIYSWFNGTYKLVMCDGENTEIPVSRLHVKEVKEVLGI